MTIKLLIPAVLAAGLAWGAAMAAEPGAAPATASSGAETASATDAKKPDPAADPVICRRIEVTGSHLGAERVCKTKKDWAIYDSDQDDDNSREIEYIKRKAVVTVPH